MKSFLSLIVALLLVSVFGCSSRHKAKDLDTKLENEAGGAQKVGVRDGKMVVLSRVDIVEKLRTVQNETYALEDKVYGTRKLGSLGLYGELKTCERQRASRQRGGSGTLVWSEPLDRLTDKEEEMKIGLDENKELIGLKDEYLRDRLERFQGYKLILQKRQDEFTDRIENCQTALKDREVDENQPSKVMVQEINKGSLDKEELNQFMCGFVKEGASLKTFLVNAFAKGWLSLTDFQMDQSLLSAEIKDKKGKSKSGGLLFNSWKLAFDKSDVKLGDILSGNSDAALEAWSFEGSPFGNSLGPCLKNPDGQWNP